ncbi:hypothetical protein L6274_05830 [Candidatus Parcubacteria bacterium]|nr:hypothetical protein [Candidatus Parcubacteria bacterium]
MAICLTVSLIVGYIAAYRSVGYIVTSNYLTEINNQKIEETGQNITSSERREYAKKLFQNKEFKNILLTSAIKISLTSFILVILIMLLLLVKKAERNLLSNSIKSGDSPK